MDVDAKRGHCRVRSVIFLRSALGTMAVKQPAINVGSAFAVAADAALGAHLKPAFSPYKVLILTFLLPLIERRPVIMYACAGLS